MSYDTEELVTHPYENAALGIAYGGLTIYPKKYAQGFCYAVLCCGYTLTDFSHIHQAYFTGTVAI